MAPGFSVGDLATPEVDGAFLAVHDAKSLAGGTGLFGAEEGGLPLQEFLDGPASHGTGGSRGDLLDVVGIEVQVRPHVLMDTARDDFAPSLGHALDPSAFHR